MSVTRSRFRIGMRNIKTGLAVFCCLLFYRWIGRDGYFLACTSAIICMQDSIEKSVTSGLNRILGTAFGALLGMGLLYLARHVAVLDFTLLSATVGIILFIFLCNVIGKQDAIIIGCVVFLSIILNQTDQSPFIYGFNSCIDTFFGIFIAIVINRFIRSPDRRASEGEPDEASKRESDLHNESINAKERDVP